MSMRLAVPSTQSTLLVCARSVLLDRRLRPDQRALLLEGSWPQHARGEGRAALDDALDGRFDWIDRQAVEWSRRLAGEELSTDNPGPPPDALSAAYLGALALRYYLVKLLRPVAYFTEVQPLRSGDCVELAAAEADRDYAEVIEQLCRAAGANLRSRSQVGSAADGTSARTTPPCRRLPNDLRRWAGRLTRLFEAPPKRADTHRRVVLCGNPDLLGPVGHELLARRCRLWWLADRFAFKLYFHWRPAGVGQLVCDSSLGRDNRLSACLPGPLVCRGVDLAVPVGRWLTQRIATHGAQETRLVEQVDAHFRRVQPEALVLDEDATPLARAAVAVARRHGVPSLVVQHGAPCCRFGFAPLAADQILVWGRSSQGQLTGWGVPGERIRITGSPRHDALQRQLRTSYPVPRASYSLLLLTTVPPRDERPDALALNLNTRTYAEMLRMAFAAAAVHGDCELIVKLHPRASDDAAVRALRAEFASLPTRVVRRGPLAKWLRGVDCVLSCGSSAGVEAALAGVPVIHLMPPGASDFLSRQDWGFSGRASHRRELEGLLADLLAKPRRTTRGPDPNVFGSLTGPAAAARIADEVLGAATLAESKTPPDCVPGGYRPSLHMSPGSAVPGRW